jgi:hypothetical protein
MEPVLLLGKQRFEAVDIRIRVKGGGHVSQIYGARRCCLRWCASHGAKQPWSMRKPCISLSVSSISRQGPDREIDFEPE